MGSLLPVIIQLLSGAAGGILAGRMMKKISLETLGNAVAGILGGGLGGQLLVMLGMSSVHGAINLIGILGSIVSGGLCGGALMAMVGLIKHVLAR